MSDYKSTNDSDVPNYKYDNDDATIVRYNKTSEGFQHTIDCNEDMELK